MEIAENRNRFNCRLGFCIIDLGYLPLQLPNHWGNVMLYWQKYYFKPFFCPREKKEKN